MFSFFVCSYISLFSHLALSLYEPTDDVVQLTPANFDQVLSSDSLWLVEFYATWCKHCQNLAPEWKQAATQLKGVVHVAAVNAEEHQSLSARYGVKGFPTILVFGNNKKSGPASYTGARRRPDIVKEALRLVTEMVQSRFPGGYSDDSRGGTDVIQLTDDNFDETVLRSEDPWLVEFFAPWCGHCKNLKPHWERAATELKGIMKVGAVDATVHSRLTAKYNIGAYPTIKFFPSGAKLQEPTDYDGGRTSDDIVRWAQDKADALLPAPDVVEVVSPETFKDACESHSICVISVLPTLYDCQSACRNKYLSLLREQAEKTKKQKWGWLWTEALRQPDLESKFDIGGSGYPVRLLFLSSILRFLHSLDLFCSCASDKAYRSHTQPALDALLWIVLVSASALFTSQDA
ncbi:unnamed protein product [Dicrocoelium dendriticum]|nr:unnamed protein product [Dicrocoelium dendriticum]